MREGDEIGEKMYNNRIEKLPRKELKELQEKNLKSMLNYAYKNVTMYRRKFKEVGIKPEDIKNLEDLRKVPFTTKDDLRYYYPTGMLAAPIEKIVRFHTSSGTTGDPIVLAYTKRDIKNWSNLTARCLATIGVSEKDVFQNMIGYTLFTGGLGYHYGAELLNAAVIPSGSGKTKTQVKLLKDLKVTSVHAIPSYMIHVAEVCDEIGIDPKRDLYLERGIFGAEPWSNGMREKIEDTFEMDAFDNYGLSELTGPGVAVECECKDGLHLWSDYFLAEIIDPESGEKLNPGEKGELVLTTLKKEAMPILRYRTRDIASLEEEKCACGRTHPRISKIFGRTDDMIIVRGTNVFPTQIEDVLIRIPGLGNNYQLMVDRDVLDELTIKVEMTEDIFSGELFDLLELKGRVERELGAVLNLRTNVELVEPKTIPISEGKIKRIVDLRSP